MRVEAKEQRFAALGGLGLEGRQLVGHRHARGSQCLHHALVAILRARRSTEIRGQVLRIDLQLQRGDGEHDMHVVRRHHASGARQHVGETVHFGHEGGVEALPTEVQPVFLADDRAGFFRMGRGHEGRGEEGGGDGLAQSGVRLLQHGRGRLRA